MCLITCIVGTINCIHKGLTRNLYANPVIFAIQEIQLFSCSVLTSPNVFFSLLNTQELGDLGLVAKASRSSQPLMHKPEALTVAKVFDTFRIIAKVFQFHCSLSFRYFLKWD